MPTSTLRLLAALLSIYLPLQPQKNVLANPLPPPLRDLFGFHSAEGQQVVLGPPSSQESEQVLLQDEDAQPQPRRLHGKFLHITDFHPDEFYKAHSSTADGIACHRENGPAGYYGAETTDCDSPMTLVNATFEWIKANLADQLDFVIWTGDSARHDSDEHIPRDRTQVLGTNRRLADLFSETFADPNMPRRLAVPVVPNLGNNDILPHNILNPGPTKWLQYYADIWRDFIPEEQRHAFQFGGWFDVEVIPNKLSVFSLNTMYLFDRNAAVDGCALPSEPGFKQMEWLRIQLQILRERGMKAILMGHVPPAHTSGKQNWDETCWQKYNLWLRQFRDVIVGSLYGHMNINHFILHDTEEINIEAAQGNREAFSLRETMEDEFSVESASDYLQELRDNWSQLPKPKFTTSGELIDSYEDDYDEDGLDVQKKKKNKHKKKHSKWGGKYAERYHMSLISPSIVPNYFPTLRVYEYNITGLENNPVWSGSLGLSGSTPEEKEEVPSTELPLSAELKRDLEAEKKKKKKDKKKNPEYPNLNIPDPPSKSTPPGPAYSPQPLTFLGYTQYFANLTQINNDMTRADAEAEDEVGGAKWRDGVHKGKEPKTDKPHPKRFQFQVEYSTFTDKIYKLSDLTVSSYVKLAYRIGQYKVSSSTLAEEDIEDAGEDLESQDFEYDEDEGEHDSDGENNLEAEKKKKKKDKKHEKKKKKKKKNKVWLHFLRHAFVDTIPKKKLKKLS